MREEERIAADLAETQHGVFRRGQLELGGVAPGTIDHLIVTGVWVPVFTSVYRVAGSVISWRGRLLGACWAAERFAVASHRAAARLWDLPGGREEVLEITGRRWRRKRHTEVVAHETTALDRWDVRIVDGIPVTSPERTLLDLGSIFQRGLVEMAWDEARHRELVDQQIVEAMLGRIGRSGRNGAGVLREVVGIKPVGRAPESRMETRLLQTLRRNGLPDPVPQLEIYDNGRFIARVDAGYPAWKIAIEYESLERHVGREALVRDSRRRNRVLAAEWGVVTATVADLRAGGTELCQAIRALASRNRT